MVVSLTAGESKDVPFTWYMYEAGDAALTCKPLLPSALNGIADLVVDDAGATSEVVTWEYQEEVEEFPLIIWIVAIAGFMGLALVIASQSRKVAEAKSYTAHEEASIEDDEPLEADDDGVEVEENAEADDEEVPEEMEEESTSSIYDLQPESED
jgi:hypothetical protein